MSKRDNLLAIDYVKSASTGGAYRVVSSGGGSIDTSGFLLLDGTRAMTGSFDVGGNNITNVNLVDGIDIAAHAANPNAHHARQHSYDSTSDHTGTLSWANVNKAGSNLTDIITRAHNSLQSIGANDHHNQIHAITGSDHTVTGSNFDLVGLTGTNTLGILTPSSNVSSGIERILKSNSSGNLNLASLTTTLINSGSGATLEVSPGKPVSGSAPAGPVTGSHSSDDRGDSRDRSWPPRSSTPPAAGPGSARSVTRSPQDAAGESGSEHSPRPGKPKT